MNFWTHVAGAFAFFLYGAVRLSMFLYALERHRNDASAMGAGVAGGEEGVQVLGVDSAEAVAVRETLGAPRLAHVVSILLMAALYTASAAYHASGGSVVWSAYLLWLDANMIYVALAASEVADVLVASLGDPRVQQLRVTGRIACADTRIAWQAWADPILATTLFIAAFTLVRFSRWPSSTWGWVGYDHYGRHRDTLRRGHVDGAFGPVRGVTLIVVLTQWIAASAYQLRYFDAPYGTALVVTKAVGAAIILLTAANDAHELTDRRIATWSASRAIKRYLPNSHTIWHIAALVFSALAVGLREGALVRRLSRNGCA